MNVERETPGPGQESVWDYPRPPRLEDCHREIEVVADGRSLAKTTRAKRVLETSHPPVYYIPPEDVEPDRLVDGGRDSFCEWKGVARYVDLSRSDGHFTRQVAWFYPNPTEAFAGIRDWLAFYPHRVESCSVDGEIVQPQPGDFYGGWITRHVVGPFKGAPGTMTW